MLPPKQLFVSAIPSGNCYKVQLVMAHLGLSCPTTLVDLLGKETRSPAFLARNPIGRVPLLRLDDDVYLPESNAILCYLAEGSTLMPSDRLARARVMQWLFFEQYSHEPNIAVLRFMRRWGALSPPERVERLQTGGHAALAVMEGHLRQHDFFAADRYTIADIALFAYTHLAEEAGFALTAWPAIVAWLERVAAQPGFVPMTACPAGQPAIAAWTPPTQKR